MWTARALGYRARQGIRPEEVALAVVVQQLVPADLAGVLFTADPLTYSLVDAKKRGVNVDVVLDKSNEVERFTDLNILLENGDYVIVP